jgi:multidrug efflux pump subunit AcrA (membrane-fusion protein)
MYNKNIWLYPEKLFVDEGQKVRKGQVLFQLETQSLSQMLAKLLHINVAPSGG